MLPVVVPAYAWTLAILVHAVALAVVSLVPLWFGEGLLYGLGAGSGGGYFVWKSVKLYRDPSKENAMANFFASLVQLGLLIAGALARQRRSALVMTRCRISACGAIVLAYLSVASGYAAPASLAARPECSARQGKAGDRSSDRQLYAGRHERSVIGAARLPRQAAGDQPGLHRLQFGLPADHPACHRRRERGGTDDRTGPLQRAHGWLRRAQRYAGAADPVRIDPGHQIAELAGGQRRSPRRSKRCWATSASAIAPWLAASII